MFRLHSTGYSICFVVYERFLKREDLLWVFRIFTVYYSFINFPCMSNVNDSVFLFVFFSLIDWKKKLTYNGEQLDAQESGKEKEGRERERQRNAIIYPQNKCEYQAQFSIFLLSFSYCFLIRERRFSRKQIRSFTVIVTFFPFFFFLRVLIRYTPPFRSEDLLYFYPQPPSRPSVLSYFFLSFASSFVLHER